MPCRRYRPGERRRRPPCPPHRRSPGAGRRASHSGLSDPVSTITVSAGQIVRCSCASLIPGMTGWPCRSIRCVASAASARISASLPTARMRSPRIASACACGWVALAVKILPLYRIRSGGASTGWPRPPQAATDSRASRQANGRMCLMARSSGSTTPTARPATSGQVRGAADAPGTLLIGRHAPAWDLPEAAWSGMALLPTGSRHYRSAGYGFV